MAHMLPVHGGDHHHIRQLIMLQHFFGTGKAVFLGNVVKPSGFLHLSRVQICHGNYFHLVREQILHGSIGAATVTKTRNRKSNRRLHKHPSF